MELRVYNPDMSLKGILENQSSVLWNRSYNGAGTFEAHFPVTELTGKLLTIGNLISFYGAVDAGVIEYRRIEESSDRHEIMVSGRFLTAYLDRRVILGTMNFTGYTEVAMRTIISNMNAIPLLYLGTLNGYTETVEFQATYKNVLEYIEKLASSASFGFRMRPNFTDKKIYFEIYKGEDHSIYQTDRNRVEFSERYNNIERIDYTENDQLYKNVAYVGGEGEGSARVFVTTGETSASGLARREMFVDARDLQSDGLTTTQYQNVLKQRGNEKLDEAVYAKYLECEVVPTGNFEYKRDYNLGDIVTVIRNPYGIKENLRITELTEVYENGNMNVQPTFGTPLPVSIDWSEN